MKAFVSDRYGLPDVMRIKEIDKPQPGPGEVLIKIKATSVNPYDWHFLTGKPYFMRAMSGLFRPKNKVLGADLSGVIEEVGSKVDGFRPGDEVFGEAGFGAYAEYVCAPIDRVVLKPKMLTFEEAGVVPLAAYTAYMSLKEGLLKPSEQVLINGGSGGVGTFCVQMAKAMGAEVTAVCRTRNVEMVKSIGADHIIDYTQEDFVDANKKYDLIVDNVGNKRIVDLKARLKDNGRIMVVGYTSFGKMLKSYLDIAMQSKKDPLRASILNLKIEPGTLKEIKELIESGLVKPVIEKQYNFEELPIAMQHCLDGHARAKLAVTIE